MMRAAKTDQFNIKQPKVDKKRLLKFPQGDANSITNWFVDEINSDWDDFGYEFTQANPVRIGNFILLPSLQVQDSDLETSSPADIYLVIDNITELSGDIRIEENKLKEVQASLSDIRKFDRVYKKYSIYLQAVHRDGIPMLIIRKKFYRAY